MNSSSNNASPNNTTANINKNSTSSANTSSVAKLFINNVGCFVYHGEPLSELPHPEDLDDWAYELTVGNVLFGGIGNLSGPIPELFATNHY